MNKKIAQICFSIGMFLALATGLKAQNPLPLRLSIEGGGVYSALHLESTTAQEGITAANPTDGQWGLRAGLGLEYEFKPWLYLSSGLYIQHQKTTLERIPARLPLATQAWGREQLSTDMVHLPLALGLRLSMPFIRLFSVSAEAGADLGFGMNGQYQFRPVASDASAVEYKLYEPKGSTAAQSELRMKQMYFGLHLAVKVELLSFFLRAGAQSSFNDVVQQSPVGTKIRPTNFFVCVGYTL